MVGPNPTDRGKIGTKRHVLTDHSGIPLSVTITGANMHDMKAVTNTLDGIMIRRPITSIKEHHHHLCLDKGYDFPETKKSSIKRRYIPHIRHRGEERIRKIKHTTTTKRWVVERTNSWHNRFRKLLIRYEKKSANYLALVQLACCLILYRRIILG